MPKRIMKAVVPAGMVGIHETVLYQVLGTFIRLRPRTIPFLYGSGDFRVFRMKLLNLEESLAFSMKLKKPLIVSHFLS